jgi:DNA-binding XRE family transcriptional regulator
MYVKPDGEKVRALRGETNATQFAYRAGISPTTLRMAERGRPLELRTARKISAALDVHPREFCRAI